ncbi:MAG: alpha/beta hydrolase [Fibrobacteraceae bacterium]
MDNGSHIAPFCEAEMTIRILIVALLAVSFSFAASFRADSLVIPSGSFSSPSAVWHKGTPKVPKVFVWFHGGMQSLKCAKGYEAGAALVPFMGKLSADYAVMSVSACGETHWLTDDALRAVDIALDSLALRWKVKIDEVSLVGVSDGGLGVLGYSLKGRRKVRSRLLVSTNLSSVADAKNLASSPRIKVGTWRFFQGGHDRLYPSRNVFPWIDAFCKELGSKACQIQVDEQGEHDWSWWTSNRSSWIADFVSHAFSLP